jgi:hypothetical protein
MAQWSAGWTTEQFWFDSQHGQATFPQYSNPSGKALFPRQQNDEAVTPSFTSFYD